MVHRLEFPHHLAGRSTQCNYGICVTVVAQSLAAVVIGTRTRGGQKDEISRRVDRHYRPDVCCTRVVAIRTTPALVVRIGWILRDRIESPSARSSACVEGAHFTAWLVDTSVVANARADYNETVDDDWRRRLYIFSPFGHWRIAQPFREIDRAVIAEIIAHLSGVAIDRDQACIDRCQKDAHRARSIMVGCRIDPCRDTATCEVTGIDRAIDM